MQSYFGYTGLLGIIVTITSIALAWWALQAFRFDIFTANPKSPQAKTLQIILAVVLGHQLAQFFIDYLGWSFNLQNLF